MPRQEDRTHPQDVVIRFGKHNGATLGEIAQKDPDYLEWLTTIDKAAIRAAATALVQQLGTRGSLHDRVMPFGKHEGMTLGEIAREDSGYLDWLIGNTDLSEPLRKDIEAVLE